MCVDVNLVNALHSFDFCLRYHLPSDQILLLLLQKLKSFNLTRKITDLWNRRFLIKIMGERLICFFRI